MSDVTRQLFALLEKQPVIAQTTQDLEVCCKEIPLYLSKDNHHTNVCLAAALAYGSRTVKACATENELAEFNNIIARIKNRYHEMKNATASKPLSPVMYYLRQEGKI